MIHNLPGTPAFLDEPADSPISELALRVVVEFEGWELHVVGTATLVSGYLAITARHVLEHVIQKFGARQKSAKHAEIDGYSLRLYQVLPGPNYRVWNVHSAWTCPTDIAILHLGLWRTSMPKEKIEWRSLELRVTAPPVGENVLAFGYRESQIAVRESDDGQHHIELNDKPTTSIGKVREVYPEGRDAVLLPFPCYKVGARFDAGMSGGLVIDESGSLCGLICASLASANQNEEPISYVASLWPMLTTTISANRGDKYARDVQYPMIDLALDGLIAVNDLQKLDPKHFPGKILPG